MVTFASVEAFTIEEAKAKVAAIYEEFGDSIDINLSILASAQKKDALGYAFTWLKNNLGTQEEPNMFGAIEFNVITDMTSLPQRVASAASAVENAGLMGASYKPIIFCGTQPVRGTNYFFIAEETRTTNPPVKKLVTLKVNEFQGKFEIVPNSITEIIFT